MYMRQEMRPTIVLLTRCADNLSKLYCETGCEYYKEEYTRITALVCAIKERIKRVENNSSV